MLDDVWAEFGLAHARLVTDAKGVYAVEGAGMIKIGKAVSFGRRLHDLQSLSPVQLNLVACLSDKCSDELKFHHRWKHLRAHGEWFRFDPELARWLVKCQRSGEYNNGIEYPWDPEDDYLNWLDEIGATEQ